MFDTVLILLALAITVARPFFPGAPVSLEDMYEAFAHIVVGMMIAAAVLQPSMRRTWLIVLAFISAGELLVFFLQH